MADFENRYPLNVPGKFYVDDQCTDCDLCRETAPNNVKRDDRMGHSYVYKQPETVEEHELLMEGVRGCPTEAVGNDGDKFDWQTTPIKDWNALARHWNEDVSFDLTQPVVPEEETERKLREAMAAWRASQK